MKFILTFISIIILNQWGPYTALFDPVQCKHTICNISLISYKYVLMIQLISFIPSIDLKKGYI